MKKKWIVGLALAFCFLLSGTPAFADSGTQEIKSIEEPVWLFKAGISKGKYHDRQDLGFILREKTELKVRQVNPEFTKKITLRLLSNDKNDEKSVEVGSDWVTISSGSPTVPFFDTPYGTTNATIEYQIDDPRTQKPLPIYEEHGDQKQFFDTWDKYDGNYALIKGTSFQLLVPKRDKSQVKSLKDFKSIDELIAYYEDIFAKYNQYMGLDNSAPENKVNENRYFLKADAHGAGGAYYGNNWAANSTASADMWLKKNSWGSLHEIAHGFQASFDGKGIYTGEVSNNLFGVQYQYDTYGKAAEKTTWLFNYGKKDEVENALYRNIITEGKGYSDLTDHRYRLILLTMIKQKAGTEGFAKMYQEYRNMATTQANFNSGDYLLPDLMNKYYSETSGFDFTPALEKLKMQVDQDQAEINRLRGYRPVASLVDVVPEAQLAAAHALVDEAILINSNFELVDNQTIAPLGLKGNLTVTLDIDDVQAFKGRQLKLKDGDQVVSEATITDKTVQFTNVPNGVYSVEVPSEPKDGYQVNQYYAYVKEADNNVTIPMTKIVAADFANEKIDFLGLGNSKFATFETNLDEQQAVFSLTKEAPHSYFKNEKYVSIEVVDPAGTLVYSKEMEGTNNQTSKDVIPFGVGYQVNIFHAEVKNRLVGPTGLVNKKSKQNSFTMTDFGLQNAATGNNPEAAYLTKVTDYAAKVASSEEVKNATYSNHKSKLYIAIQRLTEPNKTNLMTQYSSLFN